MAMSLNKDKFNKKSNGGKKSKPVKKVDIEDDDDFDVDDEDFDMDDFDDLDDEDDEEEIPKKNVANPKKKQPTNGGKKSINPIKGKTIKRDVKKKKDTTSPLSNLNPIYILAGCGLVIALLAGSVYMANKKAEDAKTELKKTQEEAKAELDKAMESASKEEFPIEPGVPDIWSSDNSTNSTTITDNKNILKDLEGKAINPDYEINRITTVVDFVNYVKYRATTSDGLEFYWLEAMYKGRPYKIQIPLTIYKELEDKGITVVDVEVTETKDGQKLVTYMDVRDDANELLRRRD